MFPSNRGISMCPWYTLGRKISDKNVQQWIYIEFCVKIGKSASETLVILTLAYGEYAMKKMSISEWQRWFKEGQEDGQEGPKNVQPKCSGQMPMLTEYKPWHIQIED
jgi:hypothetical protein